MKSTKLKLHTDLGSRGSKGDIITVECDRDRVPIDGFWRERLRDSAIDNCVEVVTDKPPKRAKAKKEDLTNA